MGVEAAKVTLAAIMKDELPYILEWVAYYRLIGFDEIVVYSNDSTDGSLQLLDALSRAGVLTHRIQKATSGPLSPQVAAYADAARRCKTEWIAFFDADEFLVLKADAKVGDFINRFGSEVSGIAINWRIFGSAGKLALEPGLVIERFTRASKQSFSVNGLVKSIVRVRDIQDITVHSVKLRQGQYVNSSGVETQLLNHSKTPSIVTDLSQINHYCLKSKEEFEYKKRRGRADFPVEHPERFSTRTDEMFAGHDRNEEEDLSLYNFRGKVEREIERLQELIKLAPAVPTVLLIGLSHVVAMRNAQAARIHRKTERFNLVVEELYPKFNPYLRRDQGRQTLNEAIEPELRRIAEEVEPRLILAAVWTDAHFFMSTANPPRRLDFVLPAEPDLALDPAAEVVPYDLIREHFRLHCKYHELLVEATLRAVRAPLYLVPAPPPVADFGAIAGGSSNTHIDRLVAERGLAPSWLRYKFWHLINDIYDQTAAANGVEALPAPPGCLAPDGFRRAEYNSTDWIHANAAYGELVLQQIDALLAREAES